ncbi:MAG TPA: NAD-dependent deacylase [Gemmataceae bacterium]|nr:NAD-dependent deacylase [Gemmataceae bacterium]
MHHPVDDDLEEALARAADLLRRTQRVAVLTGAGVSAESGLATFRGAGGLWEGHRVEDVATPEAFRRDPALVWRFYHMRRAAIRSARPNPGHLALVALEDRFGSPHFALITQNVDGLHQAAGSRHVLEIHGNLNRVRCTGCGRVTERAGEPLDELPHCPSCGALLRPDVVWFGEGLPEDIWLKAEAAAGQCDCFLVVGTSAQVYPAAGLIDLARSAGASVIEVNLERTSASRLADACLFGPSGQVLPQLVQRLTG